MLLKLADWKNPSNSIKPQLLNCTEKFKKCHRLKKRHFIPDPHMELPSFLHIGALWISVKPTTCLLVMAFCSIMKVQEEAKRLLHEKLPDQWQRYILVKWNVLNWEIWILEGIKSILDLDWFRSDKMTIVVILANIWCLKN